MTNKQLETWAWVLIYSGLILVTLGLFLARAAQDRTLGWGVVSIGAVLLVAGIVFIVLRSRRSTHHHSRGHGHGHSR